MDVANPVDFLFKLAAGRGLSPPLFQEEYQGGPSHERVSCCISQIAFDSQF